MLMPGKVKFRKQQRGRRRGKAFRGGTISFGEFGLSLGASSGHLFREPLPNRLGFPPNGSPA